MARHREFDEDKVLNALRDIFWEHGFEGTSYADIMAATGLQKGSLYSAFGDKRALYQKTIARNGPVEAAATREGCRACLLCNALKRNRLISFMIFAMRR